MHDPLVLLFHVKPINLDIWHVEPNGHDSGGVCGHHPMPTRRRILWAVRHVQHLHFRFWPYLNVKRWIVERCDGCGRRFRWKEGRFSYQSTNKVWHDPCMSLGIVRGQLEDMTDYLRGVADDNARWRVEYRLKNYERCEVADA